MGKHICKRKYAGQREELVKNIPHRKVLHTMDENEQICEKCGSTMLKVGEEFVRTEVQFIPARLKVVDHYREVLFLRNPAASKLLLLDTCGLGILYRHR